MFTCLPAAPNACTTAARATPLLRVASITINDTTSTTSARADCGAAMFNVLEKCAAPAEQRAHAYFAGSVCDKDIALYYRSGSAITAGLVNIEVWFPLKPRAKTSILSPLTTAYPTLLRSLQVLTILHNDFDESDALGAFAAQATHLQKLSLWYCGLTNLQGLEGRCEYLRKVNLYGCRYLISLDGLGDCVYLEEVDVSHAAVTSIEPLRTCPALTKVHLYSCRHLSSIEALADHQRLQDVNAAYTGITSIEPLRSCPHLTIVVLTGCRQLPADVTLPTGVTLIRYL